MAKLDLKYVGHNVPRVDGFDKVTGKAKFVGDLNIPGMLDGKILRSAYPHARIRSIDVAKAEALPGVVAVLTASDIGHLKLVYNGRPVIAIDKVRYVGEPVAAVAAADPATALAAACSSGREAAEEGELPPPPPPPTVQLSIDSAALDEGDTGSADLVFAVTLSAASTSEVSVDYATSDASATQGEDYIATGNILAGHSDILTQMLPWIRRHF